MKSVENQGLLGSVQPGHYTIARRFRSTESIDVTEAVAPRTGLRTALGKQNARTRDADA